MEVFSSIRRSSYRLRSIRPIWQDIFYSQEFLSRCQGEGRFLADLSGNLMLARRISDSGTIWLLRKILSSFSINGIERERESKGVPIGNLTSQLFANIYLNEFDHFIKEELRVKYYIRYTDDFVLLHDNPIALASLLPAMRAFLQEHLALELHPRKVSLRKLQQGIDFLGYVVLPHYRVLRTRARQRILNQLSHWEIGDFAPLESYLGMLAHCKGYKISKMVRALTNYDECWQCGIMHPT